MKQFDIKDKVVTNGLGKIKSGYTGVIVGAECVQGTWVYEVKWTSTVGQNSFLTKGIEKYKIGGCSPVSKVEFKK